MLPPDMVQIEVPNEAALRGWNDQTWALNIVILAGRPNGALFVRTLEFSHYPPSSPEADQLKVAMFHWQDMPWVIARIPLRDRAKAEEVGRITKMRLANGIPHLIKYPPPAPADIAAMVNLRRKDIGDPSTIIAGFPLDNSRTFTLEQDHGTKGGTPGGIPIGLGLIVGSQSKESFAKAVAAAAGGAWADYLKTRASRN